MNKFSKFTLILTVCAGMTACSGGVVTQGDYNVIPLPKEITPEEGQPFALTSSVKIYYPEGNAQMKQNAEFLASYVEELTGFALKTQAGEGTDGILLKLDKGIAHAEGYRLHVNSKGIEIAGASEAGVFYGIQTLRKSIPADAEGSRVMLPAVTVNDYPRFAYRGMMLDVGRHFFPVDSIKIYLDMLALHNINRFHWHLSDDQGWRIEIKKYPKLTEVGSQRSETVIGHNSGKYDGKPYGGFYTQDEIRDVIAYAAKRHITMMYWRRSSSFSRLNISMWAETNVRRYVGKNARSVRRASKPKVSKGIATIPPSNTCKAMSSSGWPSLWKAKDAR